MINKKSLSEQIYESLKEDILNQKIRFGDKLVNRELQGRYEVSSTPVRDAINRLYLDGLVEDITKSGARVIQFDLKVAVEINEIVCLLNLAAIKLSAEKSDVLEIAAKLGACIENQKKNIDNQQYFEYDYQFHKTFFEYAKNAHFINLYAQYHTLWKILTMYYYHDKERKPSETLIQHQGILDAYRHGDVQSAQSLMDHHFRDAELSFQRALQRENARTGK